MTARRPGAGTAFLAYAALLLGFVIIGVPVQQQNVVVGLWVTEAVAIALPAVVVLLWAGQQLVPSLGLRTPAARHIAAAVLVAALNQPIVSLLTYLAREVLPTHLVADFDAKQRMLDGVFAGQAPAMLLTVAIAAPLGEELFFRGFALPALRRSFGVLLGVLISSALFSALHLDPVGFIGLLEIGAMCALLRIWSGSLWPAIICHAVNNGIAGGAFVLGYEDPDMPPPKWLLFLGGLLLAGGLVLATRVLRGSAAESARLAKTVEPAPETAPRKHWAWPLAALWAVAAVLGSLRLMGVLHLSR